MDLLWVNIARPEGSRNGGPRFGWLQRETHKTLVVHGRGRTTGALPVWTVLAKGITKGSILTTRQAIGHLRLPGRRALAFGNPQVHPPPLIEPCNLLVNCALPPALWTHSRSETPGRKGKGE